MSGDPGLIIQVMAIGSHFRVLYDSGVGNSCESIRGRSNPIHMALPKDLAKHHVGRSPLSGTLSSWITRRCESILQYAPLYPVLRFVTL